jgi:hypothetical protein
MQAGHYVSRVYSNLLFNEQNVNCQCYRCNIILKGNHDEYAMALQSLYGNSILIELHKLKHLEKRWTIGELEELIAHYTT